jgi:hypothetical protein
VTPTECPWCHELAVEHDEVDNGVGMQQVGPDGCEACHAVQMDVDEQFYARSVDGRIATAGEVTRGWWRGTEEP